MGKVSERLLLREFYDIDTHTIKETNSASDTLYLVGIIQKADTKNQNGRIYPRKVLEKAIKEYQKKIDENRSAGEANHPACVREGAKLLTKDGWKDFREISLAENILTLNIEKNELEYQEITDNIVIDVDTELFKIKGLNIDTAVTGEHKFYIIDRYGAGSFVTIEEIYNNRTKYDKSYIPKNHMYYPLKDVENFILSKIDSKLKKKYSENVTIPMEIWSSFLGLYLAEGCCSKKGVSYKVNISQNNNEKGKLIEELLQKMPFLWKKYISKNGKKLNFSTSDKRLNLYLRPLGLAWEKYIPQEMKFLAPQYLQNIIDWYLLGDGRISKNKEGQIIRRDIFSTSRKMMEDFSEILIKSGGSGNLHIEKRNHLDGKIEGRIIKKENRRDMHFLRLATTNGLYLDQRFLKIEKIPYKGKVYCVSVPNQTFFAMDNDKIYLSGNSSIDIDLLKISHIIKEIWWEKDDLYGRIQITSNSVGKDIRALVEDGLKLGISSRGHGSVSKKDDAIVVNDDFELICFDLVHDPSTAGAFLLKEGVYRRVEEAELFTENNIHKEKNKLYSLVEQILKIEKV